MAREGFKANVVYTETSACVHFLDTVVHMGTGACAAAELTSH